MLKSRKTSSVISDIDWRTHASRSATRTAPRPTRNMRSGERQRRNYSDTELWAGTWVMYVRPCERANHPPLFYTLPIIKRIFSVLGSYLASSYHVIRNFGCDLLGSAGAQRTY